MFLKNSHGDIAVLVSSSPETYTLALRGELTSTYELRDFPHTWEEKIGNVVVTRTFTREWQAWTPVIHPLSAPDSIPVSDADTLRKIVKGSVAGVIPTFTPDCLQALIELFPEGDWHLFDVYDGFIHRFRELSDLQLCARRRGGHPIAFGSLEGLQTLEHDHLGAVAAALEYESPTADPKQKYLKELFEMAKKAKASKKAGGGKKSSGTVAQLHALFDSKKDAIRKGEIATGDLVKTALDKGITKSEGTVKTQLQIWRKEKGIKANFKRAPKKVSPAVKKAAKKAKAAKKSSGKKKGNGKPLARPTSTAPAGRVESAPPAAASEQQQPTA